MVKGEELPILEIDNAEETEGILNVENGKEATVYQQKQVGGEKGIA